MAVLEQLCRLLDGGGVGEYVLDLGRRCAQLVEQRHHLAAVEAPLALGEEERDEGDAGDLRQEALGGGNRDLHVGLDVERPVAFARDAAAHDVGDGEDLGPLAARQAHGGEGVCRLSRLAQGDDER